MNIIAVTGAANDLIPLPENLPLSSINSAFAFVVAAFAVEEEVVGISYIYNAKYVEKEDGR